MKAALIYYSRSGHTKKIADQIIATFHPDVFVVEPVNAYGNYATSVLRVIGEKMKRSSNLLATSVSDFSSYDTVFIGFPVWASTVPDFMQEYLRKANLAGKRVIPFATAGANGKDNSLKKIQELCNGSTVTDYFYTSMTKPADVGKWLKGLSRLKEEAEKAQPNAYTLDYLKSFEGKERETGVGSRRVWHDISMKQWRLFVQLDEKRIWFLSIFFHEDGSFSKFSLDKELASDSHYEFVDEAGVRKKLYQPGDEKRLLDAVLCRYVAEYGGDGLLKAIWPYITAQFHYD